MKVELWLTGDLQQKMQELNWNDSIQL